MSENSNLLQVECLTVSFEDGSKALDDVSFVLPEGKITALIGRSGSGKSIASLAIMGILPKNAKVKGAIYFNNKDLLLNSDKAWQNMCGKDIAMIFQEPMSALNPLMPCGVQIKENLRIHNKHISKSEAKKIVIEWLSKVKIPDPEIAYYKYPHQMSGGQKQRIMIAMAMINQPKLLIADEPTTALDVLVQKEIIELIKSLQSNYQTTVLFITHDLSLAQTIADNTIEIQYGKIVEKSLTNSQSMFKTSELTKGTTLLNVENLSVAYINNKKIVKAVDNVSLQILDNESVGLIGGSGCGKTTLSRALLGIIPITEGTIYYKDRDITHLNRKEWQKMRKEIQIVYQDPYASLNPRLKIGHAISEPLKIHTNMNTSEIRRNVEELLEKVHLSASDYDKYPHQFSGGQRQRICIARALALMPKLVICDESVAALDVIVQQQILDLLSELQHKFQLSYLFISHDLRVVKKFCDRIYVMDSGKIVESGTTKDIMLTPDHNYTRQLINATPDKTIQLP